MSDPNQPSWLSDDNVPVAGSNPAATAAAADPPAASTTVQPLETSNATAEAEDENPELPSVILMMRLANMGVAIGMIVVSIFGLIPPPGISLIILAIYGTCGGLLICCLETQLKFLRVVIAVNFGFLFNSVARFLFYMLLASLCWSYEYIGGYIIGIAWAAVALFNTYVLCRYPAYRRMRDKIAEEEDKRIEARISREVRKQAVQSVTGR